MPETKQMAALVDKEKYTRIRVLAAKRDMAMADWLREAIDEKLEREVPEEGNSAQMTAD